MAKAKFISVLRFKWLTPSYDFLIKITRPENKIKPPLIENAYLTDGASVLDFGCGTATLTIMAKEHQTSITITTIDIDKAILKMANENIGQKKFDINVIWYHGQQLPFAYSSFDRIISCLVFHHLKTPAKQKILAELFRVTKQGGQIFIADFGRSESWLLRLLYNLIRGLNGFIPTHANAKGLMPSLIIDVGYVFSGLKQKF